MTEPLDTEDLFEPALTYPDADAKERLAALVGLDDHKERLRKMLTLLVVPNALRKWAREFHEGATSLVDTQCWPDRRSWSWRGTWAVGRPRWPSRSRIRWRATGGST